MKGTEGGIGVITFYLMELITAALDDSGLSALKPVMPDGSLGQQVDSTDIAEVVAVYMLKNSVGGVQKNER